MKASVINKYRDLFNEGYEVGKKAKKEGRSSSVPTYYCEDLCKRFPNSFTDNSNHQRILVAMVGYQKGWLKTVDND